MEQALSTARRPRHKVRLAFYKPKGRKSPGLKVEKLAGLFSEPSLDEKHKKIQSKSILDAQ